MYKDTYKWIDGIHIIIDIFSYYNIELHIHYIICTYVSRYQLGVSLPKYLFKIFLGGTIGHNIEYDHELPEIYVSVLKQKYHIKMK